MLLDDLNTIDGSAVSGCQLICTLYATYGPCGPPNQSLRTGVTYRRHVPDTQDLVVLFRSLTFAHRFTFLDSSFYDPVLRLYLEG
eukprot:scaffold98195_cov71-Attheya_sp.AAC.1